MAGHKNARMLPMKICPYCAAQIQDKAIVCIYCGRDLERTAPWDLLEIQRAEEKNWKKRDLVTVAAIVVIVFLALFFIIASIWLWRSY